MKKKVSELEGVELDYWVAQAEGRSAKFDDRHKDTLYVSQRGDHKSDWIDYAPSRRWSDGGPIIERAGISIERVSNGEWAADCFLSKKLHYSDQPLKAAMRCLVSAKFGEEVETG